MVIIEQDCGTDQMALMFASHIEGGDVVEPLRERVLGRVVGKEDVIDPETGERRVDSSVILY